MLLPFAAHQTLEWKVLPLAFVSNVIYFTVDLCASEMEAPFGDDDMDVDMPKMIRRMDKCDPSLAPPRPAPPRSAPPRPAPPRRSPCSLTKPEP